MKKIWKKYAALLCLLVCVFSLTGCSEQKGSGVTYDEKTKNYLENEGSSYLSEGYDIDAFTKAQAESIFSYIESTYFSADRAQLEANVKAGGAGTDVMKSFLEATENLGNYKAGSVSNLTLSLNAEELIITGTVSYDKRDVNFSSTFGLTDGQISSENIIFEKELTLVEILEKAGMNTLIGMGSVFLVLILISLIISCFKYVSNPKASEKSKNENKIAAKPQPVAQNAAVPVANAVADDEELAAVISAAIAAAEGTSTEGFVVRSIKRVHNSNWRKS